MSEIPISSVVKVNITTTPQTPSERGFGTLLALGQTSEPTGNKVKRLKFYSSLTDVAVDYNASDEVYKMANTYFAQNPKPDSLYIGFRYTVAQHAWLQSSSLVETDIPTWTAITDGSFSIKVNGTQEDINSLDFSTVADMDDVASVIDGASANFNCTWDGVRLFIKTVSTGASATVEGMFDGLSAGTYIGDLSGLSQGQATRIFGVDAESNIADALDRLDGENSDWYALALTRESRDNQDVIDASTWIEAKIKLFYTVSNNSDVLDANVTSDIASTLNASGRRRTWVQYSSIFEEYPEVSAFGRSATVNFNQDDSTLTMKFKDLPLITAEAINQGQLNTAISKGCNVYHQISTVSMVSEGMMSAGVGVWQDTIHGIDWLQNSIETNIFALLRVKKKVPFTDKGTALLEQQMIVSLEQGRRNGLIADSGTTIDGVFLPNGYTSSTEPVANIPLSQKQTRQYGSLYFTAIGAGAIHGVTVEGTFEG